MGVNLLRRVKFATHTQRVQVLSYLLFRAQHTFGVVDVGHHQPDPSHVLLVSALAEHLMADHRLTSPQAQLIAAAVGA